MDITNFIASHRNDALLLGDYNAYRTQLSRRLLTLRRKLGRASPRGRKYAPQITVTAQDVAGNHEFVHLLLLTSERAWAHAMHMKSTHSADTSTKGITGSARRHIISRLRKASNYANQLVRLLQDRSITGASAENVLEARAYLSSLAGSVEFEKQGWERCVKHYAKAHMIYTALATSTTKDVFKDLLNNIIDPSIRYAAYQLRLPRTLAVATIARRHFPRSDAELIAEIEKLDSDLFSEPIPGAKKVSGKENDNLPRTVSWRSRTVNLEDASIAQALASVIVAEEMLSGSLSTSEDVGMSAKEKAAAYDGVLISSQDAVDATKSAIDELTGEGVGPGDKRMQALQVTRTAVNYALIGWRIGRNRILCGEHDGAILEVETIQKPKKPRKDGKEWIPRKEGTGRKLARLRERVVLYDATLQSLDSVKELPGVAADEAFMTELEAKRGYFQALKCLSIARSHALISNHKNALALLARALGFSSQSVSVKPPTSSSESGAPLKSEVSPDQAGSLQQSLQGLVSQHRALVELHNICSTSATADKKKANNTAPLIERLDEYPANGIDLANLVTYPPKIEPIPVKPLFLDIAWNYIEYPGRPLKAVQSGEKTGIDGEGAKGEEKKEAKRGWFGFGRS